MDNFVFVEIISTIKWRRKMNKEERKQYFEGLFEKIGITTKEGRKRYLGFLIKQKKSEKFLNQKQDIEVLEEMLEVEK